MESDLDRSINFFKGLGITFTVAESQQINYKDQRANGAHLIIINRLNFHFDTSGKFLGVENEDFREFIART